MSPELFERVSGIDGSVILDPQGLCYAIGVILDGEATADCTPSRGSRFNSATRYVRSHSRRRLAIVCSDDRTIDIIPLLRPQINRGEVEKYIAELEIATLDTDRVGYVADLAYKTKSFVQESATQEGLGRLTKTVTFDVQTLDGLRRESGSDEGKVFNLV
ncbi:MAG TPA: hypothetical protein VM578_12820 [Candidatus Saccharimonadales bacterium]|nr:hypothetical protein [Candidatus Saccharimonadales bacterium]